MSGLAKGRQTTRQGKGTQLGLVLVLGMALGFQGCISSVFLKKNERLLVGQRLRGVEQADANALRGLYRQKENTGFLSLYPWVWVYYSGRTLHRPELITRDSLRYLSAYQRDLSRLPADSLKDLETFARKYQRFQKDSLASVAAFQKKVYAYRTDSARAMARSAEPLAQNEQQARLRQRWLRLLDDRRQEVLSQRRKQAELENRLDLAFERRQTLRTRLNKKMEKIANRRQNGNWMMRSLGEKPTLFDTAAARKTEKAMEEYLKNHGFFDAHVYHFLDSIAFNKAYVTYNVKEYSPRMVIAVKDTAENATIQHLLDSTAGESFIKPNTRFDLDAQNNERERISKLLRNQGYFNFNKNYVFVENDTADGSYQIRTTVRVVNPPNGSHKRYRISDIKVRLANETTGDSLPFVTTYNGIQYSSYKKFRAQKILDKRLRIHPGEWFHADRVTLSQAQLANMDIFRFANFSWDTSTAGQFALNIVTTRNPRFSTSEELGLVVSAGAPGPYFNTGFKVRDIFGRFEIVEFNFRYSEEGQLTPISQANGSNVFRVQELGANISLTTPRLFPNLPWVADYLNAYNPKTRFLIGFTRLNRPEYGRNILSGSFTYSINPNNRTTVGFSPLEININDTRRIDPGFAQLLTNQAERGNLNLLNSFNRAYVSNVNAFYLYNTINTTVHKRGWYLRVSGEFGGLLPHLYGLRAGWAQDEVEGLTFYRYWRGSADARLYQPIGPKNGMLVIRLTGGLARPWGSTFSGQAQTLPWEKFFFSGGSNSIRAWAPRRLGPGAFPPEKNADGTFNYNFERPGELLLEANIELRRKLAGVIDGALFMDIGNVWGVSPTDQREGARFNPNLFYRDIAVGLGYGIRLDFSFLIIRLDVGTKAYDPAYPIGQRWRLYKLDWRNIWGERGQTVFNFGVGYPF